VRDEGLPRRRSPCSTAATRKAACWRRAVQRRRALPRVWRPALFERAEIKHALAYLRLLENPHDDTSFLRVVNFPPRGIGARTLEACRTRRAAGHLAARRGQRVPGKAGANLAAFVARIDVLREQTAGHTLREIIEQMLEASGLIEHYRGEKEGQDRIENLQELVNAAESFVTQEGFGRDAVALPVDEQGRC
jgi:DNA helicase-2/ATP-dependent DNA helicase PcrA